VAGAVVDASVAVKWFIEEDRAKSAKALIDSGRELWAPSFILLEVAHSLFVAARQGRTTIHAGARAEEVLPKALHTLVPDAELLAEAAQVMRRFEHPIYDCLYVALARSTGLPLVTADERQHALARRNRTRAELL